MQHNCLDSRPYQVQYDAQGFLDNNMSLSLFYLSEKQCFLL